MYKVCCGGIVQAFQVFQICPKLSLKLYGVAKCAQIYK